MGIWAAFKVHSSHFPGRAFHSQSDFAVDLTCRRIRWAGALKEGRHWKRELKLSMAELLWYNIRHAGLHE
jgi:hypothetical protein